MKISVNIFTFLLVSSTGSISCKTFADSVKAIDHHRQSRSHARVLDVPDEFEPVKFENPTYLGRRVDWCLIRNWWWGEECGTFAADYFCRMNGYLYSDGYMKENDIGNTIYLGNNYLCDSTTCDGFKYIMCSACGYQEQNSTDFETFNSPKYKEQPLDYCLFSKSWCGGYVANAYCRMKGYHQASDWEIEYHPGEVTRVIGNNQDCNPDTSHCDSFDYIDCSN